MAAIRQPIARFWLATAYRPRSMMTSLTLGTNIRFRPAPLVAPISTTSQLAWLNSSNAAGLSPDHEIRRPQNQQKQSLYLNDNNGTGTKSISESEDWLDVWNDSAEAEEAIRAYKEGGVAFGLSNIDGQLNFVDENATDVDCGGLLGQK